MNLIQNIFFININMYINVNFYLKHMKEIE